MEVAWLGVYPALPIQLAKLGGGGGECSHAASERFFNSYVLVTGGGREKGCSLATRLVPRFQKGLRSWVR